MRIQSEDADVPAARGAAPQPPQARAARRVPRRGRAGDRPVPRRGWPVRAALVPDGAERSRWADGVPSHGSTSVIEVRTGPVRPPRRPRGAARAAPRRPHPRPRPRSGAAPRRRRRRAWSTGPPSPGNLGTIIRTADALGAAARAHHRPRRPPLRPPDRPGQRRIAVRPAGRAGARATRRWSTGSTAGGPTAPVTVYATDEEGDVVLRPGAALARPAVLLLGTRAHRARPRPCATSPTPPSRSRWRARPARSTWPSPTGSSSTR